MFFKNLATRVGRIAKWIAFLLLSQRPPGSILGMPRFIEWTVQSLIVDQTHLHVVISGKASTTKKESTKSIGWTFWLAG